MGQTKKSQKTTESKTDRMLEDNIRQRLELEIPLRRLELELPQPRLIGAKKVEQKVGYSRWTLWRLDQQGLFPKRIRVPGSNKSLWVESEVDAWIAQRMANRK